MLKVFKGKAVRSYENEFFRQLALRLTSAFEESGIDGILYGMPKCLLDDNLQIDACLITEQSIIIIDFKEYSGSITLPIHNDFRNSVWTCFSPEFEEVTVKGGSAINPFVQLGRQRGRLDSIINKTVPGGVNYDKRLISTIACFAGKTELVGSIPPQFKLWFYIADIDSIIDQIFDIIDVDWFKVNLLDNLFTSFLNSRLFDSPCYSTNLNAVLGSNDENSEIADIVSLVGEPDRNTECKLEACIGSQIDDFVISDKNILICDGIVGSDKVGTVELIKEAAYKVGYSEVRILAYSNRIKRNLMQQYDEVESIYSAIYDFSSAEVNSGDSNFRIIPCRESDDLAWSDEAQTDRFDDTLAKAKTLFIIAEAQLLTDDLREDPNIRFGSGCILSDLMQYAQIDVDDSQNKMVFIGDKFLLSYGSWDLSCMNVSYFHGLTRDVQVIEIPDPIKPTPIEGICSDLASFMKSESYAELDLEDRYPLTIVDRADESKLLTDLALQPFLGAKESKVLVFSNKQALNINRYIKSSVLGSKPGISAGDLVVFGNQVNAFSAGIEDLESPFDILNQPFDFAEPKRIENGTFAKVLSVDDSGGFESSGEVKDVNGETHPLRFVPVTLQLEDCSKINTHIIQDYLESESSDLGQAKELEYQAYLNQLIRKEYDKYPFDSSSHYFVDMRASGDYVEIKDGEGLPKYRSSDNKRELTKFEKQHRAEVRCRARMDVDSKYYKVQNAARVKFGWALTLHRAVSYQWPSVSICATDTRGRSNKSYFEWLYTAISRSTNQVNLIRWKPITLFDKTKFGVCMRREDTQIRTFFMQIDSAADGVGSMIVNKVEKCLLNTGIRVVSHSSHNWHEQLIIANESSSVGIAISFNKKGQVSFPRYQNGNQSLFDEVIQFLKKNEEGVRQKNDPVTDKIIDRLEELTGAKTRLDVVEKYEIIVEILDQKLSVLVQIYHEKEGQVSQFNYISGSREYYDRLVSILSYQYGL